MDSVNSYVAKTPYRAVTHSNMSQDVISTAKIVVDSISERPVAAFRRLNTEDQGGPAVEALVVANPNGAGRRVCHVARDLSSQSGWRLDPLFGEDVSEVAAGVAYAQSSSPGTHGFFIDGPELHSSQFDGANWSAPETITLPKGVVCSNLRVTYTPGGAVVLYGQTADGNLVTATQKSVEGPFTATVCDMEGALKGGIFSLCMVDEQPWALAANINGKPWLFMGESGAAKYATKAQVAGFSGQLAEIATGYYNVAQATWIFLMVDTDGGIHSCSPGGDAAPAIKAIPNSKAKIASAAGHVSGDDGTLHVYATDNDHKLWVLHQSKANPWNDDGTPNWVPAIPLGSGVSGVFSDTNPAVSPALFALDGELALRLHHQDPVTSLWRTGDVHQAANAAFEVVRFRIEVNLSDGIGVPLANEAVTLSLQKDGSAVEVSVGNQLLSVQSGSPAHLQTGSGGKLTFAIMTNAGMACPDLAISAAGLPDPIPVSPSGSVHTYLSGEGNLNPTNPGGPLPQFDADGKTLTAANGGKLAPGAAGDPQLAAAVAAGIQQTAKLGKGATATGIVGYAADLTPGAASFREITSPEELTSLLAEHGELTGFWDELKNFFGDIWEGIKNAAIAIKKFIVDAAEKVAHLVLEIGEWIAKGVQLLIKGIEEAAHFIAGIFQAIGAAIEKVIDWLKALFDFGAIWRTKMAFEDALVNLPLKVSDTLSTVEDLGNKWFDGKLKDIQDTFDDLAKRFEGQSYDGLPQWQSPSDGPATKPVAGKASASDFVSNVHHNWLYDKVGSNEPANQALWSVMTGNEDLFEKLFAKLGPAMKDFESSLLDLGTVLKTLFTDPGDFGKVGIPALIEAIGKLLEGFVDLTKGLFDALMEFGEDLMTALGAYLTTELPLGFLNTLWAWLAKMAGYESDSKLNAAALLALLAAFPSTILFKLIVGVDKEPFASGKLPDFSGATAIQMPWECVVTANVLQILQFFPAVAADIIGNAAPGWLIASSLGMSLIIWVLTNGYPSKEVLIALGFTPALLFPLIETIKSVLESAFMQKNRNDVADGLISFYGLGKLVFGAYTVTADSKAPTGARIAAVLLPLGPLFGFLNLSDIRDSEAAPFAIGANVVFDFTAYIGGGLELLLDTLQSQHIITAT